MRLILLSLLFFVSWTALAQPIQPDSLYVAIYTTGPAWDKAKLPNEQKHFKDHSMHLSQLRKNGTITAGARYSDKGVIFFKAASLNAARELMESDVAIRGQLFTVDVQKLNVFYEGCLEKQK